MFGLIRFFLSLFVDHEMVRERQQLRGDEPPPDTEGWKRPIGG